MLIAIDIDGVIANMMPELIRFHNDNYGTSLNIDHFQSHDLWKTWGGTFEDTVSKVNEFYASDYFSSVKPINGSLEGLNTLKSNNNLIAITARPTSIEHQTKEWIERHFGSVFSSIYMTNQYSLNSTGIAKSQICSRLGVDVLIEDSLENALECSKYTKHVFLFDTPWNKCELPENITRVHSWEELLGNIKKIE